MGANCSASGSTETSDSEGTTHKANMTPNTGPCGVPQPSHNTVSPYDRPPTHSKCVNDVYPRTQDVTRFAVPPEKVSWDAEYLDYRPVELCAVQQIPIEEDEDFRKIKVDVKWNTQDSHVNRTSHQGPYQIVDSVPRNPVGRTGVCGRGRLARWGPNHAADPILTRWKRGEDGHVETDPGSHKPLLQFIAIVRGDSGKWAIPGGFVDSGEEVYNALKREFCEEAMDSEQWEEAERPDIEHKLNQFFTEGTEVYRGYVDDPRNTDNAWMESVAVNFHDDSGDLVGRLRLHAGDDAIGVNWKDVSSGLELYASHVEFVHQVAVLRAAHW